MESEQTPLLPSQHVARRVRELRERRRWTQQDLADRLAELDFAMGRPAITKIEAGDRGISLDEGFALAAALGVAPVHLFVPLESDEWFAISKKWTLPAYGARAWVRGFEPVVPLEESQVYRTEVPKEEWAAATGTPWGLVNDVVRTLPYKDPGPLRRETVLEALRELLRVLSSDTFEELERLRATDEETLTGDPPPRRLRDAAKEA